MFSSPRLRVEPLLELVEDEQHLLPGPQDPSRAARRQGLDQAQLAAAGRDTPSAGPCSSRASVSSGGRLDVDGQDVARQPGQQPRLDQRRLAAARRPVDQPDPEGLVGVGRLDPGLPEPDALGQTVPVPRAGQQLQEEVGIVLVEGAQPLRDDLDRVAVGVGSPGTWRESACLLGRPGGELPAAGSAHASSPPRCVSRKSRRSSAMSAAVVYRSDARFASALRQIRSSSLGIVSSICRGGRGSAVAITCR